MNNAETSKLKKGELVTLDYRHKVYGGMVFEVESVTPNCCAHRCYDVALKQPYFDGGFRLTVNSRSIQKYEG
jgi:hypothetical protein